MFLLNPSAFRKHLRKNVKEMACFVLKQTEYLGNYFSFSFVRGRGTWQEEQKAAAKSRRSWGLRASKERGAETLSTAETVKMSAPNSAEGAFLGTPGKLSFYLVNAALELIESMP